MFTDLPEHELRAYTSDQREPEDFDAFWTETLDDARSFPLGVVLTLVETGLATIDLYDDARNPVLSQANFDRYASLLKKLASVQVDDGP